MSKDPTIRISAGGRKALRKLAKKEGRTLKVMFDLCVQFYQEENMPLSEQ